MVHNGIEYGDMQLIAEAYDVLKTLGGLSNAELADVFDAWNQAELQCYLIEITAKIFRMKDPEGKGDLVDQILDATAQKGTGKWTVQEAAELGAPLPTIATSVDARVISYAKKDRVARRRAPARARSRRQIARRRQEAARRRRARRALRGQGVQLRAGDEPAPRSPRRRTAGTSSSASSRASGRPAASSARSSSAASRPPTIATRRSRNLLLDPSFREELAARQDGWRRVVAAGARRGPAAAQRRARRSATTT